MTDLVKRLEEYAKEWRTYSLQYQSEDYQEKAELIEEAATRIKKLEAAGNALYDYGHWTVYHRVSYTNQRDDTAHEEAKLWEALRDALGREPGGVQ